jgi:putative ABC transport system ATP-binding protein
MLVIQNLKKIYKMGENVVVEALRGVSFQVKKGEFIAIMGPSGSGKSTLMHIIGCLDHISEGSYSIEGENISKVDDDKLAKIRNKKIGFVFQQFNLLSRSDLFHNVEVPLIYRGIKSKKRKELVVQALESVGLGKRLNHKPNEISGGEKQRTAIARALINNPSLILADEPTGNLDTRTGEEIMKIFNKLHEQGHTIILVTHEPDIAQHAQRIIRFRDGLIENDEAVIK